MPSNERTADVAATAFQATQEPGLDGAGGEDPPLPSTTAFSYEPPSEKPQKRVLREQTPPLASKRAAVRARELKAR